MNTILTANIHFDNSLITRPKSQYRSGQSGRNRIQLDREKMERLRSPKGPKSPITAKDFMNYKSPASNSKMGGFYEGGQSNTNDSP